MRILIHSNGPHVPTGYGVQCNLLIKQFKSLGHEVAVSCLYGVQGSPIQWNDVTLFPSGQADFGVDVLPGHAQVWKADLVVTIMDFYKMEPAAAMLAKAPYKVLAWIPVDTNDKLGRLDKKALEKSHALPVSISKHGQRLLREADFPDAKYVPHSIDLDIFKPASDPAGHRAEVGVDGRFVIGINAANMDAVRKSFPEQFMAFRDFSKRHPEALMFLHTRMGTARGHNLYDMIEDFGIQDRVMMSDQYMQAAGLMPQQAVAAWYQALDVLSNASYAEGFGIPILEAQACGIPVVVTRAASMPELCGSGYIVDGEPFWNVIHHAEWVRPSVKKIITAYEKAYAVRGSKTPRDKAVRFAESYEYNRVAQEYWKPLLEEVEADEA